MENNHHCLFCNKIVKGRVDKKFCNDACRSWYNNGNYKREGSNPIKKINHILLENRDILIKLYNKFGNTSIKEDVLISCGYHFNFHTHTVSIKEKTRIYCYDMGYYKRNDREYLIIENNSSL